MGVLISLQFLISCSQDENLSIQDSEDFIVTYEEAKDIAKNYFQNDRKNKLSLRSDWLGESTTFKGVNDLPGLHVFNYDNEEEKSFIIISGDNRIPPILAYGENEFPLDYIPFGVADWMQHEIQHIDSIRTTNKIQDDYIKDLWVAKVLPDDECCEDCPNYPECEFDPRIGCGGDSDYYCDGITDDNPCGNNIYFQYGPLLDTEWGQGCVYNEICPSNNDCPCDHSRTGCVATAMAQVINYFEHPSNYDYGSLISRYTNFAQSGADEIAQLMSDCGESVDMDYGCTSGAKTGDVNNALEDEFGYSYGGDYGDYGSSEPVKQNIRWNKPVIFAGCREKITFIFNWGYKGCHAWVCDGYRGHRNQCYSYLFYHMNWGWNGGTDTNGVPFNGWYSHGSWSPGDRNYQYNKRVLLNIKP